jgi:hypothetical protein
MSQRALTFEMTVENEKQSLFEELNTSLAIIKDTDSTKQ